MKIKYPINFHKALTFAIILGLMVLYHNFTIGAWVYFSLHGTEGFFAKCRNPNYLGEVLIYLAFAMLSQHWLPFLILGLFIAMIFSLEFLR